MGTWACGGDTGVQQGRGCVMGTRACGRDKGVQWGHRHTVGTRARGGRATGTDATGTAGVRWGHTHGMGTHTGWGPWVCNGATGVRRCGQGRAAGTPLCHRPPAPGWCQRGDARGTRGAGTAPGGHAGDRTGRGPFPPVLAWPSPGAKVSVGKLRHGVGAPTPPPHSSLPSSTRSAPQDEGSPPPPPPCPALLSIADPR